MENGKDVESFIANAAMQRYPNEACGFVIAKGKKTFAIEAKNEAPYPHNTFLINPEQYSEAEEMGEIVAVWHTHVDEPPIASEADLAGCEASELTWLIMSVYKRTDGFETTSITTISPTGYEQDFVGRPYIFGTFDCWSLVVDYLKRNHGITLSNHYPRLQEFWLNDQTNFFDNCFQNEKLVEVKGELQDGDILMFQTDPSGNANHTAVYIGDGKILHHIVGRLSSIDIYGGYWEKHTIRHLRHESKC